MHLRRGRPGRHQPPAVPQQRAGGEVPLHRRASTPVFILRAFQKGADGVLVSGCHPGDCHYMAGNFHARRRFAAFRKLLEFIGVDLARLEFSWVSAAEGGKWVEVVTELTERVRAMGPMREFRELEAEEPWSGALVDPELQAAYQTIS